MVQPLQSSISLLDTLRDRASTFDDMVALLKHYGVLPQLLKEIATEAAISTVELTQEEIFQACQQFYQQQNLKSETDVQAWLMQQGLRREQLEPIITRSLKLERYKRATWQHQLEHHFLGRKANLDRVIYSLIRVNDIGTAQELYFRIQEGEEPFEKLAREYSQGVEAETGGLLGPVELGVPHPVISKLLLTSKPGQLLPPTRLGEWFVILRLEKFLPAQLDEPMQQRLLNELFENWIKEEVSRAASSLNESNGSEPA